MIYVYTVENRDAVAGNYASVASAIPDRIAEWQDRFRVLFTYSNTMAISNT
jgi:hypothetical protein